MKKWKFLLIPNIESSGIIHSWKASINQLILRFSCLKFGVPSKFN